MPSPITSPVSTENLSFSQIWQNLKLQLPDGRGESLYSDKKMGGWRNSLFLLSWAPPALPASREEQWPLSCAALQELPVKTVAGRLVLESSDTSHPTPFWKTRMPPQSTLGDGPTGSELLNQNILNR